MSASRVRVLGTLAVVALAVGAAGCTGSSTAASQTARDATTDRPTTIETLPPPATCTDSEKTELGPAVASYAPDNTLARGQLPSGPAMSRILERPGRARLVVGVDENTPLFGVRNDEGNLEGLEIDLVREIARAIWPAEADHIDDQIQWKTVVTEEKVPFARKGKVDMTVSVVTMNCDRWKEVAFSTAYFTTPQRVLVLDASEIHSLADLDGKTVCVTKGSSTIKDIRDKAPGAKDYQVEARTDCLVALQEGRVDAIATHDTILFGLERQEGVPTRLLTEDLSTSNYGIAMACGADDCRARRAGDDLSLVRFVNGVLEQMRADGRMAGLYDTWLTDRDYCLNRQDQPPCPTPPVPSATYRDES